MKRFLCVWLVCLMFTVPALAEDQPTAPGVRSTSP
jgi:hypothetical protein